MSTDTTTPPPAQQRRGYPPLSAMRRSRTDRKLVGVAGGLGRWAGVDPLVLRILFVVLTLFGGSGILLYALGWLLIPDEGEEESEGQRLFNGRSKTRFRTVAVLVVVLVLGLAVTGSLIHSGPGLGGLGVLLVVGLAVVLLLRNGRRTPVAPEPPAAEPPATRAETGAYGQTPGTAYAAAPPSSYAPTAPLPPPPGETYPVYGPPAPVAPKERSILGRVTVSVALIVVGVLIGWNGATDSDVPVRAVIAAALGVVGLGLVVGAYVGRARGLVVLTLLVSAAAVADIPVRGGAGDRTWRPAAISDLRTTYRLGIGESELDLTRLDLAGAGRTRVEVRQGIGHLLVIVPDDVVVRVDADANAGELRLPDRETVNGTDLSERAVLPEGSAPSAAVLVVDAQLGVGSLEVRRETP
jgi:phage shock protein PspC (stress-responsive transcriptional regulator)